MQNCVRKAINIDNNFQHSLRFQHTTVEVWTWTQGESFLPSTNVFWVINNHQLYELCIFFDIFVQLTKCEDTLLQQKAELIFRDNIPQWKVNLDGDGGDVAEDDDNQGKDFDLGSTDSLVFSS